MGLRIARIGYQASEFCTSREGVPILRGSTILGFSMKLSSSLTIGTGSALGGIKPFSGCYPGDILVTAADTNNSEIIQYMTCGKVSHAVLMLDSENAIEAVPAGVQRTELGKILLESSEVFVLRHKNLKYIQGVQIAKYAMTKIGKAYDLIGASAAGINSGCSGVLKKTVVGMAVHLTDISVKHKTGHELTFFCSELVAMAYQSVGLSLSSKQPWLTIPSGLLKSDQLVVMAQLK